jgi:hypothetical protein
MNKSILIIPIVTVLLGHACGLNEVNKNQLSDVTTTIKGNYNRIGNIANQGQATDSGNGNCS